MSDPFQGRWPRRAATWRSSAGEAKWRSGGDASTKPVKCQEPRPQVAVRRAAASGSAARHSGASACQGGHYFPAQHSATSIHHSPGESLPGVGAARSGAAPTMPLPGAGTTSARLPPGRPTRQQRALGLRRHPAAISREFRRAACRFCRRFVSARLRDEMRPAFRKPRGK